MSFVSVQGIAVQTWETGLLVGPVSNGLAEFLRSQMGRFCERIGMREICDVWMVEIIPNSGTRAPNLLPLTKVALRRYHQLHPQ